MSSGVSSTTFTGFSKSGGLTPSEWSAAASHSAHTHRICLFWYGSYGWLLKGQWSMQENFTSPHGSYGTCLSEHVLVAPQFLGFEKKGIKTQALNLVEVPAIGLWMQEPKKHPFIAGWGSPIWKNCRTSLLAYSPYYLRLGWLNLEVFSLGETQHFCTCFGLCSLWHKFCRWFWVF